MDAVDDEQAGTESVNRFLRSLGATEEQIESAWRNCRIASLAGDLVFAEGADLSAGDLATRAGVPADNIVSLWRTLGIVVPDADIGMFTERDAEFVAFLVNENPVGSYGDELLRVMGSSLSRLAEAAVAVYVQTKEPEPRALGRTCWTGPRTWPRCVRQHCDWAMRWELFSLTTSGTPSIVSGSPRKGSPRGRCTGWPWALSTWSDSPRCHCTPTLPRCWNW